MAENENKSAAQDVSAAPAPAAENKSVPASNDTAPSQAAPSPRAPQERNASRPRGTRPYFKKRVCRFCSRHEKIDYKKPEELRRFMTERGKILPARVTGTCARHQRELAREIKKARAICLLPFVAD